MSALRLNRLVLGLIVAGILLAFAVLIFVALMSIGVVNPFHAHEHCIVQTGIAFRMYASEHGGAFPSDSNGFGNALLLLVKEGTLGDRDGTHSVALLTAPGDNGDVLREAFKTGAHVPDEKCSRIYVQGLTQNNNPEIAILFDKYPTPGGDHFRHPWGAPIRDVCMLDGSTKSIHETNWLAFASNQVELLVKEGILRGTAEHYYLIK